MKKVVTKLPAGRIVKIKKLDDGTYEVVQEIDNEEKDFHLVLPQCPTIVIQ